MFSLFSSSVQFSYSVVSDCLWPHRLQHARLPCPSPRVCSELMSIELMMPFNRLILSLPLLLLAFNLSQHQGLSQLSRLFLSGGQSIRVSASALVLPMVIQGWFPIGLTGLISLQSKGLSRVFCSTTILKHQSFSAQPCSWSNSHIHIWLLENHCFD